MERFFDIFISFISIILISPVLLIVVIILKFTGEGEILFLQPRVGKEGKLFNLIKFATMLKESPKLGTGTITIRNDERILPFGKFLRKTKINEIPQLFNVLFGQMSLIGPRPLTVNNFNFYNEYVQNKIKKVKPGLSGLGSIIFRSEEQYLSKPINLKNFYQDISNYKGEIEDWFVINKNLKIYFKLIFITIYVVVFPKSKIVWKLFKKIPTPPRSLSFLNYD